MCMHVARVYECSVFLVSYTTHLWPLADGCATCNVQWCNIVWTSPSRTIFLILTNCGSDMYRATVQCCTRISIKPLPSYHATTVSRTHVLLVIECTSKVFVKCGQDVKTHYSNPVHPCTSNSDSTTVRVQLSFLIREPGSKIWSWGSSLDCVYFSLLNRVVVHPGRNCLRQLCLKRLHSL